MRMEVGSEAQDNLTHVFGLVEIPSQWVSLVFKLYLLLVRSRLGAVRARLTCRWKQPDLMVALCRVSFVHSSPVEGR